MRYLAYVLVVSAWWGGYACARPVMDKTAEAKGCFLQQSDEPAMKLTVVRPSKWLISSGENGSRYAYVGSETQRWWRMADKAEVMVEIGTFPSQAEALQAAELRVKQLKAEKNLQEQALKGGQLPGQAQGDRVWGLYDPPETDKTPNACHNIGPVSTYAAVIYVRKDMAIQVSAESRGAAGVDLSDMEAMAKKVANKIKASSDKPGNKPGNQDASPDGAKKQK